MAELWMIVACALAVVGLLAVVGGFLAAIGFNLHGGVATGVGYSLITMFAGLGIFAIAKYAQPSAVPENWLETAKLIDDSHNWIGVICMFTAVPIIIIALLAALTRGGSVDFWSGVHRTGGTGQQWLPALVIVVAGFGLFLYGYWAYTHQPERKTFSSAWDEFQYHAKKAGRPTPKNAVYIPVKDLHEANQEAFWKKAAIARYQANREARKDPRRLMEDLEVLGIQVQTKDGKNISEIIVHYNGTRITPADPMVQREELKEPLKDETITIPWQEPEDNQNLWLSDWAKYFKKRYEKIGVTMPKEDTGTHGTGPAPAKGLPPGPID